MPHPITTAALILGSAFIASPPVAAAPETAAVATPTPRAAKRPTATAQRVDIAPATVTATQMQRPARRPPPTVQALTRRIEVLEGQLRQLLSVITIDEDGAVIRARNLSFEGEQLKLEAMRVSVEAGTGLTLETGGNLTASSGGNLYLKGNAAATLEGRAAARLRSAGQARVEGSMVLLGSGSGMKPVALVGSQTLSPPTGGIGLVQTGSRTVMAR